MNLGGIESGYRPSVQDRMQEALRRLPALRWGCIAQQPAELVDQGRKAIVRTTPVDDQLAAAIAIEARRRVPIDELLKLGCRRIGIMQPFRGFRLHRLSFVACGSQP